MSLRGPAIKTVYVILGLFALTLLYFHDVLAGKLLLAERDLTTFFYPFRFVWVETPSNPTMFVTDIASLSEITRAHNVPLIVDNTLATPCLLRPLECPPA